MFLSNNDQQPEMNSVEETTTKSFDHACCAKAEPGSDAGGLLRHLVIAGKVDRRASTAISRM